MITDDIFVTRVQYCSLTCIVNPSHMQLLNPSRYKRYIASCPDDCCLTVDTNVILVSDST